jgi:glyoxylase-like metal-dependent hydrolase (beta-lactamase superfamily II)
VAAVIQISDPMSTQAFWSPAAMDRRAQPLFHNWLTGACRLSCGPALQQEDRTMPGFALPTRRRLAATLIVATATCLQAAAARAAPLELEVIQTGPGSLYTDITLVKGEKSAALIDAPFSRADAHRVVAAILESGKALETIYVTHDHPDHFFSVEVITDAFPQARVIAAPQVVEDIWKSIPLKLKRWGPVLGPNGPRHPVAPVALEADHFELEGHRLEIIGPMQGDHAHATAVWIPDAKALVAGDLLFNEMHLWFGESLQPARQAWARSIEQLAALGATTVIAGHKKPGLPDDASAIAYTRRYLAEFERGVAASKNSADLAARIRAAFPQTIDVLGDFLLGTSSKVAMGEIPPWQE